MIEHVISVLKIYFRITAPTCIQGCQRLSAVTIEPNRVLNYAERARGAAISASVAVLVPTLVRCVPQSLAGGGPTPSNAESATDCTPTRTRCGST